MNSTLKSLLFWLIMVAVGALIWQFSANLQRSEQGISFSRFMELVNEGKIASVTIAGNQITARGQAAEGIQPVYGTHAPANYTGYIKDIIDTKRIEIVEAHEWNTSDTLVWMALGLVALMAYWTFRARPPGRRARNAAAGPSSSIRLPATCPHCGGPIELQLLGSPGTGRPDNREPM